MSGELDGRVAVITGAAQGLGRTYAKRLARCGADVALLDVAADLVAEVDEEIRKAAPGRRTSIAIADVSDEDDVGHAIQQVMAAFGRVDILINNAGGAFFPTRPIYELTVEQLDRVLAVNLKGQWICARAVSPGMIERGSGKIVNISSTVAFRGYPVGLTPYAAAKAGVIGLTRALAFELGPHGITVNAIAPGYIPVGTTKIVHTADNELALRRQVVAEQCLKRLGTPEDLADAIEFLSCDRSAFITGQVINVDGGWVMK